MTTLSLPLRGALLSLAAFCAYAICDVSLKALGETQNSFQVMFLSALSSLPFVLAQIFFTNRRASLRPNLPGLTALRVAITLIGSIMVTYTFTHLPLAESYAIFFTMPLIIAVLAWPLLGEPIDLLRGSIVLAGFGGVLIALQPGSTTFQLAHLTAIAGAVTGALNSLLLRKIGHRESAGVILIYPALFSTLGAAGLLTLGNAAGLPYQWQAVSLQDWTIALQLGAMGTLGGLSIIAAYRLAPAIVVAPMQYSQIFWASILGFLFWGEVPEPMTALGIAVIIAAGLALLFVAGRRRTEQAPA